MKLPLSFIKSFIQFDNYCQPLNVQTVESPHRNDALPQAQTTDLSVAKTTKTEPKPEHKNPKQDLSPQKIAEILVMLGIEVDAIHSPEALFTHVLVAEVTSVKRHPDAEKLQLAQVFDGTQTIQVVCGAPNCRAGIRVAFAKIGAVLQSGKPITIEKTTIRGAESNGMLCSADELGIYEDKSGQILELPLDAPLGSDCTDLLWDPVFEISLTPNLGHCMSAIGIARELSAALCIPLQTNNKKISETTGIEKITATVEDAIACPRYAARIIKNTKIAPSPFWLQRALRAADQTPVNNVVDATNYILLKYGQPLHAFDFEQIEGNSIRIATCKEPVKFNALTGVAFEIPAGTLLISDAKKPIAIAGIMGGANSAISTETKNILLEAASFDPITIRVNSKKIGLRTDSSLRFEKGVDPSTVLELLDEAAALIAELSGGTILSDPIDCKKQEFHPLQIGCRPSRVNKVLGTKLSENEIHTIFHRLGFRVKGDLVEVPLYRSDISAEIDLIEEVARIYGYNNIDRPLPLATTPQIPHDPVYLFEVDMRRRLIGLGLQEFLTCDLISPKAVATLDEFSPKKNRFLQTLHSKSEEYSVLRPSLLPGLLQTVRSNLDQKNANLAVFELGRIHFLENEKPAEFPMVAILFTGKENPKHWDRKPADFDFFDLKGAVENLLDGLRIHQIIFTPGSHPTFHPSRQSDVYVQDIQIGSLGEVHPTLLTKFDIKQKVYYAELNADRLLSLQMPEAKMKPLAQFPSSERDWTLPLKEKTTISVIFDAIRSVKIPLLEQFQLIDLYASEQTYNVTFRFIYRDRVKTISFEDVEAAHSKLVEEVLAKTANDLYY
jgi:phenylalanyl-tRNA synthetase beta chain